MTEEKIIEKPSPGEMKPPLYAGRSVPFEKLSADDFEKCVFACFIAMQPHQELRVDGQPAGSGDGGFDAYGVALDSQRQLCIQCKRQNASLGLPLLAKEVAKVALTARIDKSDVGVHFFICSGGVTRDLRRLLRENGWGKISNEAQAIVGEDKAPELKILKERVVATGDDPKEVVGAYVRELDRLIAWDMDEFDTALSPAWDSAFEVLERFFTVSTAIREHPRALYSRKAYQERCADFTAVVQPQLEEAELPAGIFESSSADPGPQESPPRKSLLTVESLTALAPGDAVLVVAEGGAGKTTLLELVRAQIARDMPTTTLAVLITCADYVPGGLDTAVHAELGVKSGNWRMLPDKVQILCDGINEAPPGAVKALFGELKPLLNSNSISCIFTSREDSRGVRTILPTVPCATLRLLPLSPGRVRALACHELDDDSEVAAFSEAYRAMAARAPGPFMWTPFAVRVAVKRWKYSRQLGETLGDLLDAIVLARANRDLEISSQDSPTDLPRSSVLAIASAMAFEMLVVDGHLTCSAGAIGTTLKRAMHLCTDVLGADGLNSNEFIGLLRKHDVVRQTRDESFQWNHQLVAGALAAQHLACHWRQHLKALQQPLTDDAWVFATRRVPESELDEYLSELFHADLMLGARATAELPPSERNRSLQHIFKAIQPAQPEELQVAGLFALARVGTEEALSILRKVSKDQQSGIGFQAACALAYSGDREFLLELGAKVDECRRMGWFMSGGKISIWETASLLDRIAIARERLSVVSPGKPLNESLNLVGCEASPEDLQVLEAHFHAANDITAWHTALQAIKSVDRDRAQSLLNEELSEASSSATKATIMTMGHRLGLFVDVEAAFFVLMDLSHMDSQGDTDISIKSDLKKSVLGELPLTANIKSSIESQLPTSTGEKKSSLWQLATRVESKKLALVALDTFEKDPKSVGMAANFFLAHQALRSEHHGALLRAITGYLEDRTNWFTFNSWRILVLAVELEFTDRIAALLESMILRLAEIRELAETGRMPIFDESEAHVARGFNVDTARIHLQQYVGFLVPGAVGASRLLPTHVLLKFLHFSLASSTPGKEIVNVYREIEHDLLDDELELVRDPWAQLDGLAMVSGFKLTDRRIELLRSHLRTAYCHPIGLRSIERALEKCWNSDVLAMVVETIADFEDWPDEYQQFFWELIRMVGSKLTSADRDILEIHIARAKTLFARRVLRIWRQATLDARVGLSRIEASD